MLISWTLTSLQYCTSFYKTKNPPAKPLYPRQNKKHKSSTISCQITFLPNDSRKASRLRAICSYNVDATSKGVNQDCPDAFIRLMAAISRLVSRGWKNTGTRPRSASWCTKGVEGGLTGSGQEGSALSNRISDPSCPSVIASGFPGGFRY